MSVHVCVLSMKDKTLLLGKIDCVPGKTAERRHVSRPHTYLDEFLILSVMATSFQEHPGQQHQHRDGPSISIHLSILGSNEVE